MGSRSNKEDPVRRKVGDVDYAAKKQFSRDFAKLGRPSVPRDTGRSAAPKPNVPAKKLERPFSVFRAADDLRERTLKVNEETERQTK